jgi:hypothetical protein
MKYLDKVIRNRDAEGKELNVFRLETLNYDLKQKMIIY